MNKSFKWVHVSDIHFRDYNSSFNTEELKKSLPTFLEELSIDIDTLIISGDYRYAPDRTKNPRNVTDYIKQLAHSLHINDMKRIVTVPGNHDLTRTEMRNYIVEGITKKYDPNEGSFDGQSLTHLKQGFEFYHSLHDELRDAPDWTQDNPHCVVQLPNCNLLLLNTAITAGRDGETGSLVLGMAYVQSVLEKITNLNPIIAVGHHGFSEFKEDERKTLGKYFDRKGIGLYLCGHTHESWIEAYGENGKQVTVGCLVQNDNSVVASFEVGELGTDGAVEIKWYTWDNKQMSWKHDGSFDRRFSLYNIQNSQTEKSDLKNVVKKVEYPFSLTGYTLLGPMGGDGIKYFWKKDDNYVESIAFNKRLRTDPSEEDMETSSYTISTSIGCQLSTTSQQCRFCETGNREFKGLLTAEDMALQSIFMAEYDTNCMSFPSVRSHAREFSFMGQGEPGCNYSSIRQAIILNDIAMAKLDQKVYRYVISTCGITDFIPNLIQDIKNDVYRNRVTIHFSLNDIDSRRNTLMPINKTFDYNDVLDYCKALYCVTREKIGIGILMFDKYDIGEGHTFSLTPEVLNQILEKLKVLGSEVFRIDLSVLNRTSVGTAGHQMSNEYAQKLLAIVREKGFDGKIFSSFGDEQNAGCGMLSSNIDSMSEPGNKSTAHFNRAVELLQEAKEIYKKSLAE